MISKILFTNPTENDNRIVKFLRVNHDEKNYTNFLSNPEKNLLDFETVVSRDKTWKVSEKEVRNRNFNITNSKFISIDSDINTIKSFQEASMFFILLQDLEGSGKTFSLTEST